MLFDKSLLLMAKKAADIGGINIAASTLLKALGVTSIKRSGKPPQSGPVLIVGNHNGVFDGLVIASDMPRDNYHFVALATYGVFGENIKKQLIPIYRKKQFNHYLFEYPLALAAGKQKLEILADSEIKKRNRASIALAAQRINEGKIVSIYPTGSAGKKIEGLSWKVGVGYLIKQITHPKAQIVFTRITGTRQTDVIAYMNPIIRKLLFRPQHITITYAKPILITKLIKKTDNPKETVKLLERKYQEIFPIGF